jgi:hypothetical protein
VHVQLPENLSSVKKMLVFKDPALALVEFAFRGAIHGREYIYVLLAVPSEKRDVEQDGNPVPVDKEQECQKGVDGGFGNDVSVEAVAEVNWVDVVAGAKCQCQGCDKVLMWELRGSASRRDETSRMLATELSCCLQTVSGREETYHSRSLYMMVKKTCRNRLTAFIRTASR